jgi:two-component system chemotaxis response regulator CheY
MSKRVIFVDDSKTILATLDLAVEELIDNKQITINSYQNPLEFLELIKNDKEDYDLAFIDINMPEMNGLELVKEIKEIENFKQKPILILTTENSNEMKQKGKNLGVTGWIVKPFNDEKIVKAITKVLGL